MARMSEFTEQDWYGYAGAERGPFGEAPQIGSLKVQAWPEEEVMDPAWGEGQVTVLVDRTAILIQGCDILLQMEVPSIGIGALIAEGLEEPADWNALVALGFRPTPPPHASAFPDGFAGSREEAHALLRRGPDLRAEREAFEAQEGVEPWLEYLRRLAG